MHDHDHDHDDHDHDDHDHAPPQEDHDTGPAGAYEVLEEAICSLLIEKGVLTASEIAAQVDLMDSRSPALGAKVIARAWVNPAFKRRLLKDTRAALAELGIDIGTLADYVTVENTPKVHNVIVCTLCSCYPKLLLGIPPAWYKSLAYRSRTVFDPRGVLAEFGVELPMAPRCACTTRRRTCATSCCRCGLRVRRMERAAARRPCHARLHDRHRASQSARREEEIGPATGLDGTRPQGRLTRRETRARRCVLVARPAWPASKAWPAEAGVARVCASCALWAWRGSVRGFPCGRSWADIP